MNPITIKRVSFGRHHYRVWREVNDGRGWFIPIEEGWGLTRGIAIRLARRKGGTEVHVAVPTFGFADWRRS